MTERLAGDVLYEEVADHHLARPAADHWPVRGESVPNRYLDLRSVLHHLPDYAHPTGDAADVSIGDQPRRRVDRLDGLPAHRDRAAPRGHIQVGPVARAPQHPDPTVMRKQRGPTLNVRGQSEHALPLGPDPDGVRAVHRLSRPDFRAMGIKGPASATD